MAKTREEQHRLEEEQRAEEQREQRRLEEDRARAREQESAAPLPPDAKAADTQAADTQAAPVAAPEPVSPDTQERAYSVTLVDSHGNRRIVIAHGVDGGLAAQAAMRLNPGWTAEHNLTVAVDEVPPGTPLPSPA
jgi:hypothetical protein